MQSVNRPLAALRNATQYGEKNNSSSYSQNIEIVLACPPNGTALTSGERDLFLTNFTSELKVQELKLSKETSKWPWQSVRDSILIKLTIPTLTQDLISAFNKSIIATCLADTWWMTVSFDKGSSPLLLRLLLSLSPSRKYKACTSNSTQWSSLQQQPSFLEL